MFAIKSKEEKLLNDKRNVAMLIVQIQDVNEAFKQQSASCMASAVEAAALGHDEYAAELIVESAEMDDTVEDLEFVALKLKHSVITADALSKLGDLSKALEACQQLFRSGPNFNKLGKQMRSVVTSMHSARDSIRSFRESLSGYNAKDDAYYKVFGEKRNVHDPKMEQRIKDKKKAVELAVAGKTSAAVSTTKVAGHEAPAGMSDLAQMLGDESGKN